MKNVIAIGGADVIKIAAADDEQKIDQVVIAYKWQGDDHWEEMRIETPAGVLGLREELVIEIRRRTPEDNLG